MANITIHHGDSREVLKGVADCSVDSVVTDPPYALVSIVKRFGSDSAAAAKSDGSSGVYARASAGFMGQKWDTGETAFDPAFWAEVLRVLKPGGHVVAASGTRTYHRLACAIEDAGFEIRDQVLWLYGSGFPKSHDVSKAIDKANGDVRPVVGLRKVNAGFAFQSDGATSLDITSPTSAVWQGWGTALKAACEPWVLARKPLIGTVAANVLEHGTGALNIDGCRVGYVSPADVPAVVFGGRKGEAHGGKYGNSGDYASRVSDLGRWPANVIHDGSEEVVDGFPDTGPSSGAPRNNGEFKSVAKGRDLPHVTQWHDDAGGSAARFFYTAKADATDRLGSKHPTVKPTDLMRYLARLITPPGGVVLDPFAGSGSTGVACIAEGFDCILIEREAGYVADIERRIAWAKGEGRLTAQEMSRGKQSDPDDLPLFGK